MKSVSKFAEQLSGKVNEKVMGMSGRTSTEQTFAEAAEEDSAELGMGKSWTSGFEKPSAADYELANDVPAELSMEEQVSSML